MSKGLLIIVFVKAPRPGLVKTRMARVAGDTAACLAYRTLAGCLFRNLQGLKHLEICHSPDSPEAAREVDPWRQPGWTLSSQGEGGLGERMARAIRRGLDRGHPAVAIIGSDCPWIQPGDLEAASSALLQGGTDVVLGPAEDGGYWLIGARGDFPELFEGIAWSTDTVLEQTLDRASRSRRSVHQLRLLSDVDTWEDWLRFAGAQNESVRHTSQPAGPNANSGFPTCIETNPPA